MPEARRGSIPATARESADAVYFPACISRIMGTLPGEPKEVSHMQVLLNVAERAQVKQAFIIAYQRPPTADELSLAVDLMHTHPDSTSAAAGIIASKPDSSAKDKPAVSDLNSLCWALISSNEFLYVY